MMDGLAINKIWKNNKQIWKGIIMSENKNEHIELKNNICRKVIVKYLKSIEDNAPEENFVPQRIFISTGMSGIEEEIVRKNIYDTSELLRHKYQSVEVVHNYDTIGTENDKNLYYLGEAIKKLDKCDTVYMCRGWENHRGCVVEYLVAILYNKVIIYE